MEFLTTATALAVTAVLVITELAKLIPVEFTSKYPAWVNGVLSVVASCIVILPTFTFVSIANVLGEALLIAVVSAIAYNQFVSKLKLTK